MVHDKELVQYRTVKKRAIFLNFIFCVFLFLGCKLFEMIFHIFSPRLVIVSQVTAGRAAPRTPSITDNKKSSFTVHLY